MKLGRTKQLDHIRLTNHTVENVAANATLHCEMPTLTNLPVETKYQKTTPRYCGRA
jgi:hypothetical protein